jgi:hypothetical protein
MSAATSALLLIGGLQLVQMIAKLFDDASLKLPHTHTGDAEFDGKVFKRHRLIRK